MEPSSLETLAASEQRIASDKLAKFKGAARVLIQHLDFPHPTRQVDKRAIRQLIKDFEGEGCIREESSHRIPAIMEDWTLQAALEKNSFTVEAFKDSADHPPVLELGSEVMLECLHGQHRVLAAIEHLPASQRWWIIDIYGPDLNKETKQALREGYSYSAKYTSGEMFRLMRMCHYDKDDSGVQRWRGRFSPSQDRFLEQLFKRPIILAALDSVLNIQGIWREFYVGSLDVILFPKCDEEIASYIKFIKGVLTRILNNDMTTMMQTDPITIESIQSRSPALSMSDYKFLKKSMDSGEIFKEVVDPIQRANLTQRLLASAELIPSLYTLIKDIRYLQQPAKLLAKFLPESRKKTLRQRWFHHFAGTGTSNSGIEIQHGLRDYTTIPSTNLVSFDVCYQQLWLCSYRVYKYPNAYGRRVVAELAKRLGFWNLKIKFELTVDPAQAVIERTIQDVFHILRPNEKFNFDVKRARPVIASFNRYLYDLQKTAEHRKPTQITVDGPGIPLSYRCGQSQMDTRDLADLFLDKIHAPLNELGRSGDGISSFYVKRSRHIAFFGAIDFSRSQEGLSPHPVSSDLTVNHQQLDAYQPAQSLASVDSPNRQVHTLEQEDSTNQVVNQVMLYKEKMIRFAENDGVVLQEVPFRKEDVNSQAREYADQGRKLSLKDGGGYFTWVDCFDILTRTKESAVTVTTVVESRLGAKRRRGQDTPDRLQPVTKDSYDFNMDSEDDGQI